MLFDFIYPCVCEVCDRPLLSAEQHLCSVCLHELPRTMLHREGFNTIHHRLGTHVAVDYAMAWFRYHRGDRLTRLLTHGKFEHRPELVADCGRLYALELQADGLPLESIADVIVPAPLHWWRRLCRGYNQSEYIARGLSQVCGLPVVEGLKCLRNHRRQSAMNAAGRATNVQGTMTLRPGHGLTGRRVLLVDDIITTGATATECLATLAQARPASISLLSLALTTLT